MRNHYIDRLRGVASLGVVLSHASGYGVIEILLCFFPTHFLQSLAANAYHAVCLFFVVSGFLITNKLLREFRSGNGISLPRFYIDRVARLAPCLVLMIICALLVPFTGFIELKTAWSYAAKAIFYVSTFRFNTFPQPIPPGSLPRIWGPLWSLSVEEVFYLFFPIALKCVNRLLLLVILIALLIICPLYRFTTKELMAYFCNFDMLSIGVLTAIGAASIKTWTIPSFMPTICRWLGASVLIATFWLTLDPFKTAVIGPEFVGLGASLYLFGSSYLNSSEKSSTISPLQFFGRNSYEVYLFHMFFLVPFGRIYTGSIAEQLGLFVSYMVVISLVAHVVAKSYAEPADRYIKARWQRRYRAVTISSPYQV